MDTEIDQVDTEIEAGLTAPKVSAKAKPAADEEPKTMNFAGNTFDFVEAQPRVEVAHGDETSRAAIDELLSGTF